MECLRFYDKDNKVSNIGTYKKILFTKDKIIAKNVAIKFLFDNSPIISTLELVTIRTDLKVFDTISIFGKKMLIIKSTITVQNAKIVNKILLKSFC